MNEYVMLCYVILFVNKKLDEVNRVYLFEFPKSRL